jgi:GrpB-like predicted nucleotidyltransferase (UPF0157 family)
MRGVWIGIDRDTLADVIEIVPYQDRWRAEFAAIAHRLRSALGPAAHRIDHIGSTAVPGLAAKDVIDVQVTVDNLDAAVAPLVHAGFILKPDVTADHCPPGMSLPPNDLEKRFFGMPAGERRVNIHVRRDGRFNQRYALLFRDYVRAHPSAAAAIGATKRALAKHLGHDVEAYYDIKDPAYDIVMAAAVDWAKATDWEPGASDA